MDKEKECVCKNCENHCTCELHKVYEDTECHQGENPIDFCTLKEEIKSE